MKIVATALARNEADVIQEGVRAALNWVDAFVIYDNGSTDGTPDLAEQAGALVMRGPQGEPFSEGLRQHMLYYLPELRPDVVMRIDVDEIYHVGSGWRPPREVVEEAFADLDVFSLRVVQAEFWLTLDDVRRGALIEDERVSVQKRRRWYTIGHTALVAWRYRPSLHYYSEASIQKRRNVPLDVNGRDVSQLGRVADVPLLQKHYNCRSLGQIVRRMKERTDYGTFGKYRFNLICDEGYGLHYLGPDDVFRMENNHECVYRWYEDGMSLYKKRGLK